MTARAEVRRELQEPRAPPLAVQAWPHADRLGDRQLRSIGAGVLNGADQIPPAVFSVVVTRIQLANLLGTPTQLVWMPTHGSSLYRRCASW